MRHFLSIGGSGDPVFGSFIIVIIVIAGFGGGFVCRSWQNMEQCPTTLKATKTMLALGPALFLPLFVSSGHWDHQGVCVLCSE